jgi:hypothetical protein
VLATVSAPAGGAPVTQIFIATGMGAIVTLALLALLHGHRTGRLGLLTWGANLGHRLTGLPGWSSVPAGVALVAFASAGFGVWWDIALHIDQGRDSGPLANPAHYFILAGIYGFTAAGLLSLVLHERDAVQSPYAVKLPGIPRLPVGGALLFACGVFSLVGFPLDDMWHRLFGQDVTLWGPTHVQMISGAIVGIVAMTVMITEGQRAAGISVARPAPKWLLRQEVLLPGVLLIGISLWATEFDWGVPQYRQVWQPLLLAVAAGWTLGWAQQWGGRWGALRAVGVYWIARGILELLVGLLGEVRPAMPLFAPEAVAVMLVAFAIDPREQPLRFGAIGGLVAGAVGFAAEYAWSQEFFPLAWNSALLAEGIPTALVAGTAAGVLGALTGSGMRGVLPASRVARPAAIVAGVALLACAVNAAIKTAPDRLAADIRVTRVADGKAQVAARFADESQVKDANWLYVIAWQGGGMRVEPLQRGADGVWRTSTPVPFGGDWKTALRLHDGRAMGGISLHHPADPEVGLKAYTAPARLDAAFVDETQILQSERKDDVPGWLWNVAASLVLAIDLLFAIAVALGVARVGREELPRDPQPRSRTRGAKARPLTPTPVA